MPLVEPLGTDLTDLRIARGEPADDALVLPTRDGEYWSASQYNNWRSRVWKPIMKTLADGEPPQPRLANARPYDCRGSFVSLQLRARVSPLEVARWAGHSPQVMFNHYANVIDDLAGAPLVPVDEQIAEARNAVLELERQELDKMMATLIENPKTTVGERDGQIGVFLPSDDESSAPSVAPDVRLELWRATVSIPAVASQPSTLGIRSQGNRCRRSESPRQGQAASTTVASRGNRVVSGAALSLSLRRRCPSARCRLFASRPGPDALSPRSFAVRLGRLHARREFLGALPAMFSLLPLISATTTLQVRVTNKLSTALSQQLRNQDARVSDDDHLGRGRRKSKNPANSSSLMPVS